MTLATEWPGRAVQHLSPFPRGLQNGDSGPGLHYTEGDGWPRLDPAARHGLAGEFLELLEERTEADPAGLLLTFLAQFGSAIGADTFALADGSLHPARLFVLLVGNTSRARKGTTEARVREVMKMAAPSWADHTVSGLASGEGLISKLRDEDEGGEDKRLYVSEPEFARVLRAGSREGSTLSAVIRAAWDSGDLHVLTRKDPLKVSGAHVSIVGHITEPELEAQLGETEVLNGFGNRFLFGCVRRSRKLPHGADVPQERLEAFAQAIAHRFDLQRQRRLKRIKRSGAASREWEIFYDSVDDDRDGLFGAVTARAEAQVLRLSVAYALLDGADEIDVDHLNAALAVWRYSEMSCRYIFGNRSGSVVADRLLAGIRAAGEDGLDGTQQRRVFSGHINTNDLLRARSELESRGLIVTETIDTGGRPRLISFACKALEASKASERVGTEA